MSREIKFRAWLKEPKIMTEVEGFTEFENKIPYSRGKFVIEKSVKVVQNEKINALWWCYERDDGEETECEIMQFTGLRDCKGREIYEGDIIEFALSLIKTIKGSIEFDYGAFYLKTDDKEYNNVLLANMNFDLVEVVGNIFENEGLLK